MESSALVFKFQPISRPSTGLLKYPSTLFSSRGFHNVSCNTPPPFCLSAGKIKPKSRAALSVRANSDNYVEGKATHRKSTEQSDLKSSGASSYGSSSSEALVSSSSDDISKTSNRPLTANVGDDIENVVDSGPLSSTTSSSEPGVSKDFSESTKGSVLSKQIWSSTSANTLKTKSDPFSKTSSPQQSVLASRQRVLDALRQSEKDGRLTKFGQPVVPSNLFDEPKSSDSGSEPFTFNFSPRQLLPLLSFFVIALVMFGTTFLVWKVGAIHYNEF